MSWKDKFIGVFVEKVEDGVDAMPATLTPSTAPPTQGSAAARAVRPIHRPSPTPAPVAEIAIPEAIKRVVDQQFDDAASPALSAWSDLNEEFAATVPDPKMRTSVVLATLKRLGHDPSAIFVDIRECRQKLDNLRGEVESAKEAEIQEQVAKVEQESESCRTEITNLEERIRELTARSHELNGKARDARNSIEANHTSSIRYIDALYAGLDTTENEVHVASPETPMPTASRGGR